MFTTVSSADLDVSLPASTSSIGLLNQLDQCREEQLAGKEKLKVAVLGGQLMALREGLGQLLLFFIHCIPSQAA